MAPRPKRNRATAIIEYPDGILLAIMRGMAPALPGGGIHAGESDVAAVVREVGEETGLHVVTAVFLFQLVTLANDHAVFWVVTTGQPQPLQEVDRLGYYRRGMGVTVAPDTQAVLDQYYHFKATHPERFVTLSSADLPPTVQ